MLCIFYYPYPVRTGEILLSSGPEGLTYKSLTRNDGEEIDQYNTPSFEKPIEIGEVRVDLFLPSRLLSVITINFNLEKIGLDICYLFCGSF